MYSTYTYQTYTRCGDEIPGYPRTKEQRENAGLAGRQRSASSAPRAPHQLMSPGASNAGTRIKADPDHKRSTHQLRVELDNALPTPGALDTPQGQK